MVLRRYGFLGFNDKDGGRSISNRLCIINSAFEEIALDRPSIIIADQPGLANLDGLDAREEAGGGFLYARQASWLRRRIPVYRSLLPHVSFSGRSLTPALMTPDGHTVIGSWDYAGQRHLIIGLQIVDEFIRYTQGDPRKVLNAKDKTLWGYGHERATYLFEDNIVPKYELIPWADQLGFLLARLLSEFSGLPLLEPLPSGAKGAVLLTGDDDQAPLDKYDEQLRLLGDFPMTYLMLPHTNHTSQTLAAMPSNVEFGMHVDALPEPNAYALVCRQQTEAVRALTGKATRTVRNHGHLNEGYWKHLPAWEENNLVLDLNIRGLDGTCPTGSYLPFRIRRQDGAWSPHTSLFSTFSDSMYYLQRWPVVKQISCICGLAKQISKNDPGVIVINLHPSNVSDFHDVHRAIIKLGRQKNWIAVGAESFIDWLSAVDGISMVDTGKSIKLHSEALIEDLAYYWPRRGEERRAVLLPAWQGEVTLG